MNKLLPFKEDGKTVGYYFYCLGCKGYHSLYVKPNKNEFGASWNFNNDFDKPTFTPSLMCKCHTWVCHLFITDGRLHYLSDCSHNLAGQIVEMVDTDSGD